MAYLWERPIKLLRARFKSPRIDFWGQTWAKLKAWEREHSNLAAIWDGEDYKDRIQEAFSLWPDDRRAAFQIYFELAELGSVWSMRELGRCYARGLGVAEDHEQAEVWLRRAADGGYQLAILSLADLSASSGDIPTAESILAKSVADGWTPACFWLARYRLKYSPTRSTYAAVRPLLDAAAQEGHPVARALLARYSMTGKFGIREIPAGHREALALARELSNSVPKRGTRQTPLCLSSGP